MELAQQRLVLLIALRVENIGDQHRIKSTRQLLSGKIHPDDADSVCQSRAGDRAARESNRAGIFNQGRFQVRNATTKSNRKGAEPAADIQQSLGTVQWQFLHQLTGDLLAIEVQRFEQPMGFYWIGKERIVGLGPLAAPKSRSEPAPGFPSVVFGEQKTRAALQATQRKGAVGVFSPAFAQQAHGSKRIATNLPAVGRSAEMSRESAAIFLPLAEPSEETKLACRDDGARAPVIALAPKPFTAPVVTPHDSI